MEETKYPIWKRHNTPIANSSPFPWSPILRSPSQLEFLFFSSQDFLNIRARNWQACIAKYIYCPFERIESDLSGLHTWIQCLHLPLSSTTFVEVFFSCPSTSYPFHFTPVSRWLGGAVVVSNLCNAKLWGLQACFNKTQRQGCRMYSYIFGYFIWIFQLTIEKDSGL